MSYMLLPFEPGTPGADPPASIPRLFDWLGVEEQQSRARYLGALGAAERPESETGETSG